jgi:hypothetical protein
MTIINWREVTKASFYNGGWVKSVTAVDKSQSNGYCFEGDFISGAEQGLTEVGDGFYIVCDVQGSRKHHRKYYAVYEVQGDEVTQVLDWVQGRDWALQIRDRVADLLAERTGQEPAELTADETALVEQLKALDPERLALVLKAVR